MGKTRSRTPEPLEKLEQRELNILQLIHSGANNSRLELARLADLSPSSITAIVQRLIKKGIVVESEPATSQLGRRPIPLQVRGTQHILLASISAHFIYASLLPTLMATLSSDRRREPR